MVEKMAQVSSNGVPGFKLVGYSNFVRTNPKSDRFRVKRFHHVEFWCNDATNTARRFSWGLGMPIVSKSDLSTGNQTHASYLLRSGELSFLFTAPYSPTIADSSAARTTTTTTASIPSFDHSVARSFSASHGLGVRAIAIEVEDAEIAFNTSVAHGAKPSSSPVEIGKGVFISEVVLYGDVVLRFVSFDKTLNPCSNFDFLPGFQPVGEESSNQSLDFGIRRLDHAVGNVRVLAESVAYVKGFTGFHEFAEFTAEDVGTSESGLNSAVLASNDEMVLLPMNEPVYGTKRKSQIQTYLEHNEGEGVQHLALMSENIFQTLKEMRRRSCVGGFEFMPSPPPTYYKNLKNRVGDVLSDEEIKECEELGILVDRDDQGVLLQIFTKPLGDRPTIFIEIIQRKGCMLKDEQGKTYQKGGCGGFGKGNFSELFKSIEEYEKTLDVAPNKNISQPPTKVATTNNMNHAPTTIRHVNKTDIVMIGSATSTFKIRRYRLYLASSWKDERIHERLSLLPCCPAALAYVNSRLWRTKCFEMPPLTVSAEALERLELLDHIWLLWLPE